MYYYHMGGSKSRSTPKSSTLDGDFWGTPILGTSQMTPNSNENNDNNNHHHM